MKIGVVIPTVNLWSKYTKPCLDSLKSKHELRVVLVDNGSTDETKVEASKLVSDKFAHHRYEINEGCQEAWNWGITDSFEKGCEYVLIINNDVLFQPDAIDRLVERFEKKEDDIVMVTCCNIRGECEKPEDILTKETTSREATPEAESPDFSAFMINRKCWDTVGKFDKGFFPAYYEDSDYHRRIKLAGLKAICYPPAIYYHYGSRTQVEAIGKPLTDSSKSDLYFRYKWGGPIEPSGKLTDRLWKTPFNDTKKGIQWTLQDTHTLPCICDTQCIELHKKFQRYP